MPNYTLNSIKLSGTNVVFHPVGQRIGNSEVFNITEDNQNRIINDPTESFAHAEGSNTLAGWRSHTEGHLTLANNTSHAEGRSTMALGKASHAEGGEIYEDTGLVTTRPISIYGDEKDKYQTTIYVNKNPAGVLSENVLDENNIISIGPAVKDAFVTTDSKRIYQFDNEIEYSIDNDLSGLILQEKEENYLPNGDPEEPWKKIKIFEAGSGWVAISSEDFPPVGDLPFDPSSVKTIEIVNNNKRIVAKVISWDEYYEMPYVLVTHHTYFKLEFDDEYTPQIGDVILFSSKEQLEEVTIYKIIIDGAFYNPFNYYPGHNAPEGDYLPVGSKVRKLIRNVAADDCAHAEGAGTRAIGKASHAEGFRTEASGGDSHAEGHSSKATNYHAHAEGWETEAAGECAHAEGAQSKALKNQSHAEGKGTIAASARQHVQGKFNIADSNNKYSHIVGNGTSDTDRSNCHTLDWNGNAWYQGTIEANGIILTSPNGTRYKFTVDNDGMLNITGVKL